MTWAARRGGDRCQSGWNWEGQSLADRHLSAAELLAYMAAVGWVVGVWATWRRVTGGRLGEDLSSLVPLLFTFGLAAATIGFLVGGRRGFSRMMSVLFVAAIMICALIGPGLVIWWRFLPRW